MVWIQIKEFRLTLPFQPFCKFVDVANKVNGSQR